jgi:hypothetical protein
MNLNLGFTPKSQPETPVLTWDFLSHTVVRSWPESVSLRVSRILRP